MVSVRALSRAGLDVQGCVGTREQCKKKDCTRLFFKSRLTDTHIDLSEDQHCYCTLCLHSLPVCI